MSDSTPFERGIARGVDPAESIVRRYAPALRLPEEHAPEEDFRALLDTCSIAEGIRWFPLCTYQGVAIDVLDETSRMRTGTLKSIDGCVTTAACLARRYARIVFETGGNTGMALAAYGQRAGLETFCVVPEENLALLDSHVFGHESTRLIAVGDPAMVRPTAERLSERYGVPRVPRPTWRHLASRFRGSFVLEQLLRGERWTHFVQTISAAFGPIGIYDALDGHDVPTPTFIGVQQAENCAMFTAWRAGSPDIRTRPVRSTAALLSPVMVRRQAADVRHVRTALEPAGPHQRPPDDARSRWIRTAAGRASCWTRTSLASRRSRRNDHVPRRSDRRAFRTDGDPGRAERSRHRSNCGRQPCAGRPDQRRRHWRWPRRSSPASERSQRARRLR